MESGWAAVTTSHISPFQAGLTIQLLLITKERMRRALQQQAACAGLWARWWLMGEMASNKADMCGLWMTSSGARRELLPIRRFSRAELALSSANQFGEEGKINTGSPTRSHGGDVLLVVLTICSSCGKRHRFIPDSLFSWHSITITVSALGDQDI